MIARGTAGGREPVGPFFAIDMVVHLLLNGTSLVTRDGAEDAHVRSCLDSTHALVATAALAAATGLVCMSTRHRSEYNNSGVEY